MPFVKLDAAILESSLWLDSDATRVFLTALLMAEPYVLESEAPQLAVRDLTATGWSVPPGRYGLVRAAGTGIVHRARVDTDRGLAALERLCSPDPESRSTAYEGRRLARLDGGYVVLNYAAYRDRDYTAAARMRRYRERRMRAPSPASRGPASARPQPEAPAPQEDATISAPPSLTPEAAVAFSRLVQHLAPARRLGMLAELRMILAGERPGTPSDPQIVSQAVCDIAAVDADPTPVVLRRFIQRAAREARERQQPGDVDQIRQQLDTLDTLVREEDETRKS